MKCCSTCKLTKSFDAFSKDKRRPDGLQLACKACNAAYCRRNQDVISRKNKERRALNRDQINAIQRERYARNPEPAKQAAREYRSQNRDLVRQRERERAASEHRQDWKKAYHERTKEQRQQRWAKYSATNRVRLRANGKQYYHLNRRRCLEKHREWCRSNPEQARQRTIRYMAHLRSSEGSYTQFAWHAMLDWFGHKCLKCGATTRLTPDHVIPISKNGTNYISNRQPLCGPCNSSKKDKSTDYRDPQSLADFLESIQRGQQ